MPKHVGPPVLARVLRISHASPGPVQGKEAIASKIARIPSVSTDDPTTSDKTGPGRFADAATVLLLAFLAGTLLVVSKFSSPEDTQVLNRLLSTFSRSGLTAACWLMGATGFGVWVLRWLPEELSVGVGRGSRLLASMGLGVAVLLWIDAVLGSLGLLGSQVIAWGVLGAGILLLGVAIRTSTSRMAIGAGEGWLPPLCWTAAPALAVLMVAACSAPSPTTSPTAAAECGCTFSRRRTAGIGPSTIREMAVARP